MNNPRQQKPPSSTIPQSSSTQSGSGEGAKTTTGPGSVPDLSLSSRQPSSGMAESPREPNTVQKTADAALRPSGLEDPAQAAGAFASAAADAATSLSSDLKQTAKAASRAAQAQTSAFAADIGHELGKAAEQQKARGAEAMQGFARAISSAAGELDDQSPTVARYVRDAAKQVDSLSSNIRGRSVTELMQAATDLARSQPAVFFAGAMAAGFALSRFLKSSAADNGETWAGRSDAGPGLGSSPGSSSSLADRQPPMPHSY